MKEIKLNQGLVALIDDEDFWLVAGLTWRAKKSERTFYAANGLKPIYMHRLILNAKKGQFCDHINHDGLDNRRENLRLCSPLQSVRNTRAHQGSFSKYKGVFKFKNDKGFHVRISVNRKRIYLGYFRNEEEAALAYNRAAIEHFGEFAFLNDIAR